MKNVTKKWSRDEMINLLNTAINRQDWSNAENIAYMLKLLARTPWMDTTNDVELVTYDDVEKEQLMDDVAKMSRIAEGLLPMWEIHVEIFKPERRFWDRRVVRAASLAEAVQAANKSVAGDMEYMMSGIADGLDDVEELRWEFGSTHYTGCGHYISKNDYSSYL